MKRKRLLPGPKETQPKLPVLTGKVASHTRAHSSHTHTSPRPRSPPHAPDRILSEAPLAVPLGHQQGALRCLVCSAHTSPDAHSPACSHVPGFLRTNHYCTKRPQPGLPVLTHAPGSLPPQQDRQPHDSPRRPSFCALAPPPGLVGTKLPGGVHHQGTPRSAAISPDGAVPGWPCRSSWEWAPEPCHADRAASRPSSPPPSFWRKVLISQSRAGS